MQRIFDTLIDSFIADKVGIAEGFLTDLLAANLRDNISTLHSSNLLASAGIGNNKVVDQNSLIRNDKIYWLDRIHNNVHENLFFDLIHDFVKYLN
ncbi:MAG: 2OG-Fe(II) oxygenase, partial [Pedobacter sp.]